MITFFAGRLQVYYLRPGEPLPVDLAVGVQQRVDAVLEGRPNVRRLLVRAFSGRELLYYCVHWNRGTDVAEWSADSESAKLWGLTGPEFEGAVIVEPQQIYCSECGTIREGLVLETSLPILTDNYRERISSHHFERTCPACETPLRVSVAEWI
jgi:hypothetical protein